MTSSKVNHSGNRFLATEPGHTYQVTYDLDLGTTNTVNVGMKGMTGFNTFVSNYSYNVTASATGLTFTFTANEYFQRFQFTKVTQNNVSTYFSIDNVSIVDLGATSSLTLTYACYIADVVSYSDYYPFGSLQPGRHHSTPSYRYGFNGMEGDQEVKGEGNSYTTEFRQYDPRIGRWLSIDPYSSLFPFESPYAGFANNPIYWKDPSGLAPTNGEPDKVVEHDGSYSSATQQHIEAGLPNKNIEDGTVIVHTFKEAAEGNIKSLRYEYDGETGKWNGKEVYSKGDGMYDAIDNGSHTGDVSKTFDTYQKGNGLTSPSYLSMNSGWVNPNPSCVGCDDSKPKTSKVGSDDVANSQEKQTSNQHSNGDPIVSQEVQNANTILGVTADAAEHLNQYEPKYKSTGKLGPKNGPAPSKTFSKVVKGVGFASAIASATFSFDRAANSSGVEAAVFGTTGALHAIGGVLQLFPATAGVGLALDYIATGVEILFDLF